MDKAQFHHRRHSFAHTKGKRLLNEEVQLRNYYNMTYIIPSVQLKVDYLDFIALYRNMKPKIYEHGEKLLFQKRFRYGSGYVKTERVAKAGTGTSHRIITGTDQKTYALNILCHFIWQAY